MKRRATLILTGMALLGWAAISRPALAQQSARSSLHRRITGLYQAKRTKFAGGGCTHLMCEKSSGYRVAASCAGRVIQKLFRTSCGK